MKQRIKELDGLRGIAAIFVVLFHYFYRYNQLFIHDNIKINLFSYGKYGVELFFIISGFAIFWSLNNIQKPVDFIVSRFSRLYPVYWSAIILTFLFVSVFGLQGRETSIAQFFGNFLMFHNYFNIPNVDGVYWTLSVELTFYVWMFIIYRLNLLKKMDYILLCGIIISMIYHLEVITIPKLIADLLFLRWVAFFIIGISIYKIYIKEATLLTFINLVLTQVLVYLIFDLKSLIICSFMTLIVYLGINRRLPFLKKPLLVFLGTISYSLYLVHQNIGYIIIQKSYLYNISPLISISFSIIFSLILAVIMNKYIEKPAGDFIKKTHKKRHTSKVE